MPTLLAEIRNYRNARVLSASLAIASFTPLVSCTQEKVQAKTALVQCDVHAMPRETIEWVVADANLNGKTFDIRSDSKAINSVFKLRVIGNRIDIYRESKKIGVFVITGKPEDVTIFRISDKLLVIADKNSIALSQGDDSYTMTRNYDCSRKPFEYKPDIGIIEQGKSISVVVASSIRWEQLSDSVILPTNFPSAGLKLEPPPPTIEIDCGNPNTNCD